MKLVMKLIWIMRLNLDHEIDHLTLNDDQISELRTEDCGPSQMELLSISVNLIMESMIVPIQSNTQMIVPFECATRLIIILSIRKVFDTINTNFRTANRDGVVARKFCIFTDNFFSSCVVIESTGLNENIE